MTPMETFAIAARLHVVLRRVHGRVTDVEWMTRNREYAREVVRVAREHADEELLALADKFEASFVSRSADEVSRRSSAREDVPTVPVPQPLPAAPRYVGRLR